MYVPEWLMTCTYAITSANWGSYLETYQHMVLKNIYRHCKITNAYHNTYQAPDLGPQHTATPSSHHPPQLAGPALPWLTPPVQWPQQQQLVPCCPPRGSSCGPTSSHQQWHQHLVDRQPRYCPGLSRPGRPCQGCGQGPWWSCPGAHGAVHYISTPVHFVLGEMLYCIVWGCA